MPEPSPESDESYITNPANFSLTSEREDDLQQQIRAIDTELQELDRRIADAGLQSSSPVSVEN